MTHLPRLALASFLALPACTDRTWHLRLENQTGAELPMVTGKLVFADDPHGFGGSAEALAPGSWTQIEGRGDGVPTITAAVVWAKGEAAIDIPVGALLPTSKDVVVRLGKGRKIELVPPAGR